jgi:hypothetical protein
MLIAGIIIPLATDQDRKENLTVTGVIGLIALGAFGWGLGFGTGTAYEQYILIPNNNIKVHKTPVAYIVDFDKEETAIYTTLEECNLLDEKESLYFYKVVNHNHYDLEIDKTKYVFLRKPYVTEQEEN